MPSYKGHLLGGIVVYGIVLYAIAAYQPTFLSACEWFICALLGSLFPDIDTKSKGQKLFYQIIVLAALAVWWQQRFTVLAIICITAFLPLLVHHRGLTHRVWFVGVLACVVIGYAHLYLSPAAARMLTFDMLFFVAGVLSHLCLDLGIRKMWRI
jgi:hypothetical protein